MDASHQTLSYVMQDRAPKRKPDELGQDEVSVGRAGRKTAETLNATDRIIEALELAGKEAERLQVSPTGCMSFTKLVRLLPQALSECTLRQSALCLHGGSNDDSYAGMTYMLGLKKYGLGSLNDACALLTIWSGSHGSPHFRMLNNLGRQ